MQKQLKGEVLLSIEDMHDLDVVNELILEIAMPGAAEKSYRIANGTQPLAAQTPIKFANFSESY